MLRERESASRLKRGGGLAALSLYDDLRGAGLEPADPMADPERDFEREWVRALLAGAVESLESRMAERGRSVAFRVFVAYDLEGPDAPERPSYESLARSHDISVTQVTNFLSAMRREFRREVLAHLRALTGREEEFRAEACDLLCWNPAWAG